MNRKIEVLNRTRTHDGHFKIDLFEIVQEADGRKFRMFRENFERGNAAAVLLYDPGMDAVLTVEEFRIGYLAAGYPPEACFNMGPIAGVVEPGATAEATVIREAMEEAGVVIDEADLMPGFTILPSPGGTSEQVTMFVACADLSGVEPGQQFGVDVEAEQTWRHVLPREEALRLVMETACSGHLTALMMRLEILRLNGLFNEPVPESGLGR